MHLPALLDDLTLRFRTHDEVHGPIRAACAAHPDLATYHELGTSEEGRPLYGVVLGQGPQTVSLIAGCHADEPVGPETLRTLILEGLRRHDRFAGLFEAFRFVIVPHVNPDGEARNRAWIEQWPDVTANLLHVDRDPPGRDVEFGFPSMRPENAAVAAFLKQHAPIALHASLHGMRVAEGAMLLIERHWAHRTQALRDGFARAARAARLGLHDHNRKGEKGFFQIEPGFWTTPEGAAMRSFFEALGDHETASLFHQSSMEYVRSLGGNPLCIVTELPLFLVPPMLPHTPGEPASYLALKERLPMLRQRAEEGEPVEDVLEAMGVRPVPLRTGVHLHLRTLDLALVAIRGQEE